MSAALGSYTYETDASYAADFGRDREPMKKRSRHPEYRRQGSAPTRVSGMHCRRNKRWTWGSGRGARMANLRAFAGCVALALAAVASNAHAVTINWGTTVTGSNAAYTSGTWATIPGGIGSVNYTYRVSKTETTRQQYADFLNAVATSTSAPAYVQTLWSSTSTFGISRTVVGGSYTYAPVVDGNLPVTNVTWTSAARFVNWLNAGQVATSNTTTLNTILNTGAYTISSGSTGSTTVARNAGYTTSGTTDKFFLPSANEWVKAAFFNPNTSTWNTWQNSSSTQPTATSVASAGTNVAVYNTGTLIPGYAALPVGSNPNSVSPYGLFDMLGNVTEMTDTGNASGAWFSVSGNYSIASASIANWNINRNAYITTVSEANGFRVAGIAAVAPVPEPETITLAAFGIVGLCGANWLKRKRRLAGRAAAA
ncbi:MAG: SUMF1/EgtB/PvdO family nonheme iron enzyme [Planctomycetaceae bacterium]